jgi:hypothetical protein
MTQATSMGHLWLENTGQDALWLMPQVNPLGLKRSAGSTVEIGGTYPDYATGEPLEIEYKCGRVGFEIIINGHFVATFSALHDRPTNRVPDITRVEVMSYSNPVDTYISEFYFTYSKYKLIFVKQCHLDH